ncbi:MAG: hypothetical protein IPL21_04885 [Saprospirales bacterium]|nr:hypothetical protein [Saprospirales bacterium]
MNNTIQIAVKDETFAGKILNEIYLEFQKENVSVEEIITLRVLNEVNEYNKKLPAYFNGLVEPTDAEKTLNGYKIKPNKIIDSEKQVYVALNAFLKNGYFVLIDNIQAETLEQEILLTNKTTVSFVKLTPLVGG